MLKIPGTILVEYPISGSKIVIFAVFLHIKSVLLDTLYEKIDLTPVNCKRERKFFAVSKLNALTWIESNKICASKN